MKQAMKMEERCCSVCGNTKAKKAIGARPWGTPPSTLLQQALLICSLSLKSGARSVSTASAALQTTLTSLNSHAAVLKTRAANYKSDSESRLPNEPLVRWLCDLFSIKDLEENIPVQYASQPLILNIEKLGLPCDSELRDAFALDNLCESCEKLIRMYAKHERKCRAIATSLFRVTVKSTIHSKRDEKLASGHTLSNKENVSHKTILDHRIATRNLSLKNDTVSASSPPLIAKRKRGRPRKVPPDNKASLQKKSKSEIDCTRSVCPFCSKVYSIEHSFVHNCLAYRNSLRCVRCNVFSSTYIRFEKHLESFHHEKRLLCCQVSNCNQRFVSEPAFKWHSHFHTIEEKTVQRVYVEDSRVSCDTPTITKGGEWLPTICSDAATPKSKARDNYDIVAKVEGDDISLVADCGDPAILLLSESTVETMPRSVSYVLTNACKEEDHPNQYAETQLKPLPKYANQCLSSEMNNPQSLLCLYNASESVNPPDTQRDDGHLVQSLFAEEDGLVMAHSTTIESHHQSQPLRCGDEKRNNNSTEPVLFFVGKQSVLRNLITLDVHHHTQRSKCLDQQQFVPISMPDHSVNLNKLSAQKCFQSSMIHQASQNTAQGVIQETHPHRDYNLLQCNMCEQHFSNQMALSEHRISQCGKQDQLFSCQQCSSSFLSPVNLKRHILAQCRSIDREDISLDTNENSIKESGFAQHILLDHKVDDHQYQCPVCEQLFYVINDLVEHLNGHNSTETCKCYICSVNIKDKPSEAPERNHLLSAECPNQIWSCSVCQLSFLTTEALKKHCTDTKHNILNNSFSKLATQCNLNLQMSPLDTNHQMTHYDTNSRMTPSNTNHQVIHLDSSLNIKGVSHDASLPIPLRDVNHQFEVPNTNPSMAACDGTSTHTVGCPQSLTNASVNFPTQTSNNTIASSYQAQGRGSRAPKQQMIQSLGHRSGTPIFQTSLPTQLLSSNVVDSVSGSPNPVLGYNRKTDDLSTSEVSYPSVGIRPIVPPTTADAEQSIMSHSLFNHSHSSCQGCGLVLLDQTCLQSHVSSCPMLQPKVEAPFVDDHFTSATENLSVIKALESSSGNALTSIDHLIGSVDDMDYFS